MTTKTTNEDQYTKPELREQVKAEVMAGDKGGKPGQWSARKAQLVAHEYEARGGGYKHERTEAQEHLHEWTAEHWQTSDGKPAERPGGTTRYLPAEAWEKLSPAERKATNAKKVKGSRGGKQFVANTGAAAKARHDSEATPEQADQAAGTRVVPRGRAKTATKKGSKTRDATSAPGEHATKPAAKKSAAANQKKNT